MTFWCWEVWVNCFWITEMWILLTKVRLFFSVFIDEVEFGGNGRCSFPMCWWQCTFVSASGGQRAPVGTGTPQATGVTREPHCSWVGWTNIVQKHRNRNKKFKKPNSFNKLPTKWMGQLIDGLEPVLTENKTKQNKRTQSNCLPFSHSDLLRRAYPSRMWTTTKRVNIPKFFTKVKLHKNRMPQLIKTSAILFYGTYSIHTYRSMA